ncbi:hypothetical protein QLH51_13330 [Sphingomonas sp. 2R-10]|uniref:hypothetical protein n=1 Tax=Sphingomonas sp. 2R-10 TaxID=3045148 RepID=UPI000F7AC0B3|nr:hypothetical protein [Sphingomonas sp. 2R-10]MDJ0277780.1 hypothetical protein [Sphingomonas sp. 2R-10]
MTRRLACIAAATLSLAACSADPPANATDAQAATPVGSIGGVDPGANPQRPVASTRGLPDTPAPHAAPELLPMVRADFADKNLLGSGCTFHATAGGPVLLLVRDEGDGLVHFNKAKRRITAATPGREAVQTGGILAGDKVAFTIDHPAGPGQQASTSTRAWPATLTMRTDDGGERVYRDGRWECGS